MTWRLPQLEALVPMQLHFGLHPLQSPHPKGWPCPVNLLFIFPLPFFSSPFLLLPCNFKFISYYSVREFLGRNGMQLLGNCSEAEIDRGLENVKITLWVLSFVILLFVCSNLWVKSFKLIHSASVLQPFDFCYLFKLQEPYLQMKINVKTNWLWLS